jgi:repressor LexA
MPADKPTKKQTLILEFIRDFTDAHGYSPSYREIQAGMNLRSISAVAEHIDNCIERGYLRKTPGAARSLEILDPDAQSPAAAELEAAIKLLEQLERDDEAEALRSALSILRSLPPA